jgi:chromosomal replication initiator protein
MQRLNYWVAPCVKNAKLDKNKIVENVCEHFDITKTQLRSKRRFRPFVEARSIIGYILTNHTNMILRDIGDKVNRDYSSVIHYNKKVGGFMDVDKNYKDLVNSFL